MTEGQVNPSEADARRGRLWLLKFFAIWPFPYILAAAGYFAGTLIDSSLRGPVFGSPQNPSVYPWILVFVVLAVAWLISGFMTTINSKTTVTELKSSSIVSIATAVIFTGAAGWFVARSSLQWWFIVPWIASIVDAPLSSWLAINNAAQKNIITKRGSMGAG